MAQGGGAAPANVANNSTGSGAPERADTSKFAAHASLSAGASNIRGMAMAAIQAERESAMRAPKICVLM